MKTKTNQMEAVCIRNHGNNFDPKVGEIVEVKNLYITRIWRDGEEVSTSSEENPGYHKSQDILRSILKEGDVVEDNYCHGKYRIVADELEVDFL